MLKIRSHMVRLIAHLAVLVQVALPVAQAQAAANGTPLSALVCNPSGQPLTPQAEARMSDLLDLLGEAPTPDPMPDCERCVVPGVAVINLQTAQSTGQRFARAAHQHPTSHRILLSPVRGPPCGTRAPPAFV